MGRHNDWDINHIQARAVSLSRQVVSAFQPVIPVIVQGAVSMTAYWAGLGAAQAAAVPLRISCATPILGPFGGVLGVGLASALAGQAANKYQLWHRDKRAPWNYPKGLFHNVKQQDVLLDAVLGIAMFKLMGGRFRSVMPSDLVKVGAIGKESLPAGGMAYATEEKRGELLRFFRRDGCHHCGTRKGPSIGDHMPPNKMVKDHIKEHLKRPWGVQRVLNLQFVRKSAASLNIPIGPPRQRYYPQCKGCSQKQASAVRMGRSVLVMHQVLHQGGKESAWHYAGVLVGLRYHHSSSTAQSSGGGGSYNTSARTRQYF